MSSPKKLVWDPAKENQFAFDIEGLGDVAIKINQWSTLNIHSMDLLIESVTANSDEKELPAYERQRILKGISAVLENQSSEHLQSIHKSSVFTLDDIHNPCDCAFISADKTGDLWEFTIFTKDSDVLPLQEAILQGGGTNHQVLRFSRYYD